ncbi:MAG TPA: hypothetical protein VMF06_02075 [Candidatus Limnocylindria bacterium]|jgi:hypothetical protein|nr:hypothetical protein [Candidatus Limnocylindria bacterium]
MKTASLGTLASLAVLCSAPAVHSAVVFSTTVVDAPISTSDGAQTHFDIDGNSTTDQWTFSFSSLELSNLLLRGPEGESQVMTTTAAGYDFVQPLRGGDSVEDVANFSNVGYLYVQGEASSPSTQGHFYAGVTFVDSSNFLHFGWMELNFPISGTPTVVRAAYESAPGTFLTIPVPEPDLYPVPGAVGLAAYATWHRRRA